MEVSTIIERLCKHNFQVYITGGSIRDSLLGISSKDEDLVTNATPEQLQKLFADCKVQTVGESFGVTLINKIEVATYRSDKYKGLNDKDVEVNFVSSLEEDLARRDLTINSISICPYSGIITDPFNGQQDIKNRIIRFTGNPEERIHEDPNRIIRACRFLSKIEGSFECETFDALCKFSHYVKDHVAKERIRIEIMKALELPKPSLFFQSLYEIDALQYVFPSMIPCMEHHHGKHHREDIFIHLMIVGDSISPKFPLLRLAGYLHDVGKPLSYSEDGKFLMHEKMGAEIVSKELHALRFSTEETTKITNLVASHMYSIHELNKKIIRKLLVRLSNLDISYQEFVRLRIADRIGNLAKSNFVLSEIKNFLSKVDDVLNEKTPFTVKSMAVNGNDVMSILGIPPSKKVGEVLNLLFEKVLEYGPEFNNREVLLNQIKDLL